MTKEEAVILSAYTGYLLVPNFSDVHEFIEKILERPVWTHQLADPAIQEEIRTKCKPILPAVSEEAPNMVEIPDCKKCSFNYTIAWHQCEHCLGEAVNNFVPKEEVQNG